MWWMIPAATAALGAMNANNKAKQQRNYNLAQAEVTRYSPWTKMQGQLDNSYVSSPLEGGISGGVQGLGILQGFGQGPFSKAQNTSLLNPGEGQLEVANYNKPQSAQQFTGMGGLGGFDPSQYSPYKPNFFNQQLLARNE